jgi:hypothetical protein
VSVRKLETFEFEKFSVSFSSLKSFTLPILSLVFALFSVIMFIKIDNQIFEWIAGICFIVFLAYFRMNAHSNGATEAAFASKNSGLVVWSYKDQLNFMDHVYAHNDIEEFKIKDGILKKTVSVFFKNGAKEELSSYFLIFEYD